MASRRRWGVLISGRGSNLSALLDWPDDVEIAVVFSSSLQAQGLLRARRMGVPTRLTPVTESVATDGRKKMRIDFDRLDRELRELGVTHIVLAGFMKIVPESFVRRWEGRMINLHPSLLPAYPGLDSIAGAHRDRAALGVSVHEVNEEVDAGRILARRTCMLASETAACALDRAEFLVHVTEQRLLSEVVRRWRGGVSP